MAVRPASVARSWQREQTPTAPSLAPQSWGKSFSNSKKPPESHGTGTSGTIVSFSQLVIGFLKNCWLTPGCRCWLVSRVCCQKPGEFQMAYRRRLRKLRQIMILFVCGTHFRPGHCVIGIHFGILVCKNPSSDVFCRHWLRNNSRSLVSSNKSNPNSFSVFGQLTR